MTELRAADGRPIVEVAPAPEFFIEKVAYIEPIEDDCFRFYCCTKQHDVWRLIYTVIMPARVVLSNTLTVRDIAKELTERGNVLNH